MALQNASQRPSLLTQTRKEIIAVLQTFLCDQSLLLEGKTPLEDVLPKGGLDSLAMLRLKHSLEERLALKIPIPITILFGVDTVEALELELLKLSISNSTSIVMTFSATGSRLPVFLFPPGGREVNAWLELIKYLPDRPLHAFRLKGLQPGEDVFDNMEDITE
jgi:acyl carrier protein